MGEKLSDYRNLCVDFIEPHGNIKLEEVVIEGKRIFLYHVDQDIERIFKRKDNEQIFLRVDDRNKQLDRNAVRNLFKKIGLITMTHKNEFYSISFIIIKLRSINWSK